MAEGERAEALRERDLALVVEGLITKEHDAVREERSPDVGDRPVAQLLGEIHTRELRADGAGDR